MIGRWKRRPSARSRSFVVAGALSAILLTGGWGSTDLLYQRRILPGISINGISLSGLEPDAARARLDRLIGQYGSRTLVLRAAGRAWSLQASYLIEDIGARASAAAWQPGHKAPLSRQITERLAAMRGAELHLSLPLVKQPAVERLVRQLATTIDRPPQDARIIRAEDGWQVIPDQAGVALDRAAAADRIRTTLEHLPLYEDAPLAVEIELPVTGIEPHLRAAALAPLRDTLEHLRTSPLVVETRDRHWTLDRSALVRWGPEGVTGAGRTAREGRPLVEPDRDAIARQLRALAEEIHQSQTASRLDLVHAVPQLASIVLSSANRHLTLPIEEISSPAGETGELGSITAPGPGK